MTKPTIAQGKIGARQSVACATAGLALYLLVAIGGSHDLERDIKQIGAAFAAARLETALSAFCLLVFYSWAWIAGGFAGARIRRNLENGDSPNYLIGIGLAFSTVAVTFLAALLTSAAGELVRNGIESVAAAATAESLKNLLLLLSAVLLLGSVPAIFLGLVYTFVVADAVRRELPLEKSNAQN